MLRYEIVCELGRGGMGVVHEQVYRFVRPEVEGLAVAYEELRTKDV